MWLLGALQRAQIVHPQLLLVMCCCLQAQWLLGFIGMIQVVLDKGMMWLNCPFIRIETCWPAVVDRKPTSVLVFCSIDNAFPIRKGSLLVVLGLCCAMTSCRLVWIGRWSYNYRKTFKRENDYCKLEHDFAGPSWWIQNSMVELNWFS